MKKTIFVTSLTLLLAAAPVMAQMMGNGQQMFGGQDVRSSQQMIEQQQIRQTPPAGRQNYLNYMIQSMAGVFGMGSGMAGGFGMGSGMAGGFGMGSGMTGGFGMGSGGHMMGW